MSRFREALGEGYITGEETDRFRQSQLCSSWSQFSKGTEPGEGLGTGEGDQAHDEDMT